MTAAAAPLAGLKVVELARILADLGADVIKVEGPRGDDARSWGLPFVEQPDGRDGTERAASSFHAANCGECSVTCDFDDPDDLARLTAIIVEADVLVENVRNRAGPGLRPRPPAPKR